MSLQISAHYKESVEFIFATIPPKALAVVPVSSTRAADRIDGALDKPYGQRPPI